MQEKQLVGDMSEWSGVLADMFRQIKDGSLTRTHLQALVEHRDPFAITDVKSDWVEFYRRYFRLTVDFSDVQILDDTRGFDRIVLIPKGLTIGRAIKALKKQFPVWTYRDDLDDEHVPTNDRKADRNYAVWFRDNVEADAEFANTSANQLQDRKINCITLLERLVMELKYWAETGGEHLDINNWTLCAGSRDSDGNVPGVDWDDGGLCVDWAHTDGADGRLRARQAVSN